MSITNQEVVAVEACDNAIEICPIDNYDNCLATIMNENGDDLSDREREIANHMVNLWNQNIS